jgi:hypothetical protein
MSNVGATLLPVLGAFSFCTSDENAPAHVKLDDLNVVIPADHISTVSYFNTGIEHLFDEDIPSVTNGR